MISKENITALINERIRDLEKDLYVVELSISAKNVIRVEIDKVDGNVTVDECVSISDLKKLTSIYQNILL